jgi:hypothetical protein
MALLFGGELTVGAESPGYPHCGELPVPKEWPHGVSATLHLTSNRIEHGRSLSGIIVYRNSGSQPYRLTSSRPNEIVITPSGKHVVVGFLANSVAGTGFTALVKPGHSVKNAAIGGSTSCQGKDASPLPPGRYDAVSEVGGAAVSGSGPTLFSSVDSFEIVKGRAH